MTRLDPARAPASARDLVAFAERWGIGGGYDRELAVDRASEGELAQLLALFADPRDSFWWLAGPASPWQSIRRALGWSRP